MNISLGFRPGRGPLIFLFLVWGFLGLGRGQGEAAVTLTNCTEVALREAIQRGGHINLACATTITLSNTLVISTNVILEAVGGNFTISGGNSNRLFAVEPNATLMLRNFRLLNGTAGDPTNAPAGAHGRGGAIFNDRGVVYLINSRLENHRALGSNGADGEAAASGTGEKGSPGGGGFGGAVFNHGGYLFISNCVFSANGAFGGQGGTGGAGGPGLGGHGGRGGTGGAGFGGALFNSSSGIIDLIHTTFSSNQVSGGFGGASGLAQSILGFHGTAGESGASGGGGFLNDGGRVTIRHCTFADNTSFGVAGLHGLPGMGSQDGQDGRRGTDGNGGGVLNRAGTITLTNVTFFRNWAIGGDGGNGGDGGPSGFGGDGGDGGNGGAGQGAGLFNDGGGSVRVVNGTFSLNSAAGGLGGERGLGGGFTGRKGDPGIPGTENG